MMGLDMMMESIIKGMGLNPDDIKKKVAEFGELVVAFKAQMDRIEAQNAEIISLLRMNGVEHGPQETRRIGNGSGETRD